ncbi:hypothetical protein KSS87_019744, partial [Heliosperma pusillum]
YSAAKELSDLACEGLRIKWHTSLVFKCQNKPRRDSEFR